MQPKATHAVHSEEEVGAERSLRQPSSSSKTIEIAVPSTLVTTQRTAQRSDETALPEQAMELEPHGYKRSFDTLHEEEDMGIEFELIPDVEMRDDSAWATDVLAVAQASRP